MSSSFILGRTPIKTTSTRKLRRALFPTPASVPTPAANINTQTTSDAVTPDTAPSTLIKYSDKEATHPRCGAIAVVQKRTSDDTTTLDVLWTSDGSKDTFEASDFTLAFQRPLAAAPAQSVVVSSDSVYKTMRPVYDRATNTHRSLISDKFPSKLSCPLDSIVTTEIEAYHFEMDNYLCGGHPKIRHLITGEFEPPLLTYQPYLDYKRDEIAPEEYVFDYSTADADIR